MLLGSNQLVQKGGLPALDRIRYLYDGLKASSRRLMFNSM